RVPISHPVRVLVGRLRPHFEESAMSTAPAAAACPLCAGPLADDRKPCPQCHASPEWIEQGQALDFALHNIEERCNRKLITPTYFHDLADYYARQRQEWARLAREGRPVPDDTGLVPLTRCWSCAALCEAPGEYCTDCGAPWDTPAARSLRLLTFLR